MSVWIPRDLSEIKPSSFSKSSRFPKREKSEAEVDPYYRFVKKLLKPRERDLELSPLMTGKDYTPRIKESGLLRYETSDKGCGLIESLDLNSITNCSDLKKALRNAAREQNQEMRSGIKPGSAHKVYAWRDLLEEREEISKQFNSEPREASSLLPDKSNRLIDIYHRDRKEKGGIHFMNGYWQIPRLGPKVYRDKWGLKIIDNLEPEPAPYKSLKKEDKEYHYQWPLTDADTGPSIANYLKKN
ncbi:uncharacterized protein LOC111709078 [Eurytemora carolleeae]|uniref:uncharacterized protein LOC111709078 n=1 Tax=Eurytemora carolleeae TaxID=1294199 RepID=UPI000C789FA8|nr:uncharacterized protein LOC111709078 [Eurytemora carolleeae]|eukprot:XP_023338433.1 uncharacterized protein LOC111709078 [Eurytemora affinis]